MGPRLRASQPATGPKCRVLKRTELAGHRVIRGTCFALRERMANSLEQIEAKTVGTAHAVKAGFNGLRGVFLHLSQEHGEVGALMKRVAKSSDPQMRREHYRQIRTELLAHERAELAEVYPALSPFDVTRDVAAAHHQQAQLLASAIAACDQLEFASPEWGPAFGQLLALVEQHVQEEEDEFFPRAQEVIDEVRSKELLKRYEAAKLEAKSQIQS
jgi:hemerythrin superfamily protein